MHFRKFSPMVVVMATVMVFAGCKKTEKEPVSPSEALKEFQKEVTDERLVLVDFYTTWCGPCKRMAPLIEKVGNEMSDQLKIVKLDAEKNVEVSEYYQIQGYPTIKLFRDGKEVYSHLGFLDEEQIRTAVKLQLKG